MKLKYYMIESKASANSVYFETDDLAKIFFRYCDYYLKDFLRIEEYVLNKDGWAMLIKVRSARTVRKYYDLIEARRKSQMKNKSFVQPMEIWRILSERVRLFISTYVRMSNKILGREGSLVRRKYGRYEFDCMEEAQSYISKIRNDQHELEQTKEKYRGLEEHFGMQGTILVNPLRSSFWVGICESKARVQEELVKVFGGETYVLQGLGDLVAPTFKLDKNSTKTTHTKPPTP